MNCATRVLPHVRDRPDHPAIWTVSDGRVTFGDFGRLTGAAQSLARDEGLGIGDAVLVLSRPDPLLFATIVGLLGLGITVVFVEPWLPVRDIGHVLDRVRPKAFIGTRLAQLWALRVPAARRIPNWIHIDRISRGGASPTFECIDLDPDSTATITFSSGTTGRPKGVVRSHACMWSLHEAITEGDRLDHFEEPALCVFPNLALLHLGTGRGAVLVPQKWSARGLADVLALSGPLGTASLVTGPAFLIELLRFAEGRDVLSSLRSITVGGAQTDCWILERGFERWPDARWTHVYGGSEAEPVAKADAREAVRRSRERDRFQTLFLGGPVPAVDADPDPAGLWVSGSNVASRLDDDPDVPSAGTRYDERGQRWHNMGDRIVADADGWWYDGRADRPAGEFELEQRIYTDLGTSAGFVHRLSDGRLMLYGDEMTRRVAQAGPRFLSRYPEIDGVGNARIVRDRRHRARIDRQRTLVKSGHRGGP